MKLFSLNFWTAGICGMTLCMGAFGSGAPTGTLPPQDPKNKLSAEHGLLSVQTARILKTGSASLLAGAAVQVPVQLTALGDENAVGFSLAFDPALLHYLSVSNGAGLPAGVQIIYNTNQLQNGRLGVIIGLSAGQVLAAGTQELAVLNFQSVHLSTGTNTQVQFVDQPIPRDLVSATAETLPVNYSAGTLTIAVPVPLQITWSNPADIVYGTSLGSSQLNASANIPGNFVYSPPAGTVLNAGSGHVLSATFTPTDTVNYTSTTATVTLNVLKATPQITWANPADIPYGTTLGGSQLNAMANVVGSYVFTPPAGTILSAGAGQVLSVSFTPADSDNYNNTTATVTVNVLKVTPQINWANPADITYGTALGGSQLNATVNIPGSYAYSPPAGTVLNAGAGHVLSVTFTPTDTVNYSPVTATVSLNVLKATPQVTWPYPADIAHGTALGSSQLNAMANVVGSYVFTPPAGTILSAGTGQVLSVSFTPADSDNYNNTTATVSLNVLKVTPQINWASPADITYGTALGGSQLNATANIPGSFVYSPPAGTVLNAGSGHVLSVSFTPADTANYTVATAGVSLNILRASLTIAADNKSRIIGSENPTFTGTLSGLKNNDPITATYSCAATTNSPAGTYAIVPSLVDPNAKAANYDLILMNGILAVTAMNPATLSGLKVVSQGHFQLRLQGATGVTYRVEASTNFKDWISLLSTNLQTDTMEWIDLESKEMPRRFYRAIAQ